MILQYAHYLAEMFREDGYDEIEIRAEVFASLNNHDEQSLVDSSVDLAKEPITILPKSWITPLEKI